jgi:phosphoenolpyruvate---glycerone phosphotransferase subunit DhaK
MMDRILAEMPAPEGARVAVLVNSFGSTPLMELYVLHRRVEQRLAARNIEVEKALVGHYCTSLDMVGASVSLLWLDEELSRLLAHPCNAPFLRIG